MFLRSPHAHAQIVSIAPGRVFTAADLPRIKPIEVVTHAAGARSPPWPPLATGTVRYVGEAIAACVAPTLADAEELAAAVEVQYRPLDAVVDAGAARAGGTLVHEYFGDNLFQEARSPAATSTPRRAPPKSRLAAYTACTGSPACQWSVAASLPIVCCP